MTEIQECINVLQYCTKYDIKHITPMLESVRCLMKEEINSKAAITLINKQIANATTRDHAFQILIIILPDCSQSLIDDSAKTWISYTLSKHPSEVIACSRFQLLVMLYERCHTNQEFYKSIVSNFLPKLVDTCIWVHPKSAESQYAMNCLYFTMKYFSSACIVFKKKIEEYILQFLDSPSKIATIVEAAKCYHILNQIGGAGPNGSIHIKNFENNFVKLYKTLDVLYNAMFENINEFQEPSKDTTNIIKLRDIPTYLGTKDVYKILSRRMENIVIFLIQMIETGYKLKKSVKPEILQVVQRGLEIHVHGHENDPNRTMFNQCMQQHQIKLLFLLKALIQSLQHNFMRHSTVKILFRYLTRVSECSCYNSNSLYKRTIYDIIKYWLQCSGEQIDAKTYEKLIDIILKDITPNKTTMLLQTNLNSNKSKGKNKNQSNAVNDKKQINEETPRTLETQVATCQAALGLLETLFKSVHLNIKKATCAQLFHVITSTLLDICAKHFYSPYTSKDNQLNLFKVLIAIFDQPTFTIDINLAVNILALGQTSDHIELSLTCQQGLKTMEKIVHPIQMPIGQVTGIADIDEELSKTKVDNAAVKVLSNYLIQSNENQNGHAKNIEVQVEFGLSDDKNNDNTEMVTEETIVSLHELQQSHDTAESSFVPEDEKRESVVEISDNEGPTDNGNDDISIVSDEPASKKRKADSQEVIYTFDISQGEGEDLLDSFVDEVN